MPLCKERKMLFQLLHLCFFISFPRCFCQCIALNVSHCCLRPPFYQTCSDYNLTVWAAGSVSQMVVKIDKALIQLFIFIWEPDVLKIAISFAHVIIFTFSAWLFSQLLTPPRFAATHFSEMCIPLSRDGTKTSRHINTTWKHSLYNTQNYDENYKKGIVGAVSLPSCRPGFHPVLALM